MPLFEKYKSEKAANIKVDDIPSEKLPVYEVQNPTGHEAPPSYAVIEPVPEAAVAELNSAFSHLRLSYGDAPEFPEPDYCLAHLKLLAAFNALKREVGYSDGLFGIEDSTCEKTEDRTAALASLKEKRWALFVARAVDRFQDWWLKVLVARENATRLTAKELEAIKETNSFLKGAKVQLWTTDMLPPLGM
jgi:hypothetical protein